MHPEYQCFKLSLRGIRMFSTHVQPGEGSRIGIAAKSAGAPVADAGCHEALLLQISYAYLACGSIR